MESEKTSKESNKNLIGSLNDYLKSKLHYLSYVNLVEYALPAFILVILLLIDCWIGFNNGNIETLNVVVTNSFPPYMKTLLPVFIFLFAGWLMYMTKYYHFFPTYRRRKIKFFHRLADFLKNDFPEAYNLNKYELGKKIYRVVWDNLLTELEQKIYLKTHANWVSLMHVSVNLILSIIIITTIFIVKILFFKDQLSTIFYIANAPIYLLHLFLLYYFGRAALAWQRQANRFILEKVNNKVSKIKTLIPGTFHTYMNDA